MKMRLITMGVVARMKLEAIKVLTLLGFICLALLINFFVICV